MNPMGVNAGTYNNKVVSQYSDEVLVAAELEIRFYITARYDLQYGSPYCIGNYLYASVTHWKLDYIKVDVQFWGQQTPVIIGGEIKVKAFSYDFDVHTNAVVFYDPIQRDKTVEQWIHTSWESVDIYTYWVNDANWRTRTQMPTFTVDFGHPDQYIVSYYDLFNIQHNDDYAMPDEVFTIPHTLYMGSCY